METLPIAPVGQEETLGAIAAGDLRKAQIFTKYGLDFCCGGKKTLKEACEQKGLDPATIEQELLQVSNTTDPRSPAYEEWNAGFLADYIVNTHHHYIRKVLPQLTELALKVAGAHGQLHPELRSIHQLVERIGVELNAHMLKEENVLFPYIKQLEARSHQQQPADTLHLKSVGLPIGKMEEEHEQVGQWLEEIKTLSQHFTVPAGGCASYRLLYSMLKEFEQDMHIHIHLENNILFPKAIDLEKACNHKVLL